MKSPSAPGLSRVFAGEFPHLGTTRDQLGFCLHYAVLAPSSHNSQPWRFRLLDDAVELWADRTRSMPVVDPFDRELVISCGAALQNLRIAVEHFGRTPVVEVLPDPACRDLLARLTMTRRAPMRPETTLLFCAILERRTNRRTFEDWLVPADVARRLQDAALDEGAWLVPVEAERKDALADLIAEADRIQSHDRSFRRELAAWTTSSLGRRRDGVPGYNLGAGGAVSALAPLLIRTFDWNRTGRAAKDRQLAIGSPVLAVLGTGGDDPRAWIAAGQALERVLLTACVAGLQGSFLNQPIEVAHLRMKVKTLLACGGSPQLVLRLGYGPEPRPTPRRDIEEVLIP